MLSGVNVFEISDIQEDETEAPVQAAPNVTMLHSRKQLNGLFAYHRSMSQSAARFLSEPSAA